MIALGFLVGLTTYTLYTLAAAIANDGAAAHEMVLISASLLFVYCVGAIVSPAVASLAMRAYGPAALFWLTGARARRAGRLSSVWELLGHGAPAALSSPRH